MSLPRIHDRFVVVFFLMIFAGAAFSPLQAFDAPGTITGIVRDSTGELLVRARVSLLSGEQTVVRGTRTDAQGRFSFENINPGRYMLSVSNPGFIERRQ